MQASKFAKRFIGGKAATNPTTLNSRDALQNVLLLSTFYHPHHTAAYARALELGTHRSLSFLIQVLRQKIH